MALLILKLKTEARDREGTLVVQYSDSLVSRENLFSVIRDAYLDYAVAHGEEGDTYNETMIEIAASYKLDDRLRGAMNEHGIFSLDLFIVELPEEFDLDQPIVLDEDVEEARDKKT